jgi:hypothetical protein
VQVDGVGLGFGRDTEKTPIVTKVLPELARGNEISLAHVLVPHQSYDSDYALLIAELKRSIGSFFNGNSMPCRPQWSHE